MKTIDEIAELFQQTYPHAKHLPYTGDDSYHPSTYMWERQQAFEEIEKGEVINEVQCLFDRNNGLLGAYVNGNIHMTSNDSLLLDGFIVVKAHVFGGESCIYRAVD